MNQHKQNQQKQDHQELDQVERKMDYSFKDKSLLSLALTHKSFAVETKKKAQHNEKLEFLGDAVLDFILSEVLYRIFPNDDEGVLSKKRASLVNEEALAQVACSMGLNKYLRLGKGEMQAGGEKNPRLQASVLEALTGALFLDGGYEVVKKFLLTHFQEELRNLNLEVHFAKDYKTRLQEVIQKTNKTPPQYILVSETGPSHEKEFYVKVILGEKTLGHGKGKSKKEAEQVAAEKALKELQ